MQATATTPVKVITRGTYSKETDQGERRVAFRSGKLVEFVQVLDLDTGQVERMTLAEEVGPDDVKPDQTLLLRLTVGSNERSSARRPPLQWRVVGVEKVLADAPQAPPARDLKAA